MYAAAYVMQDVVLVSTQKKLKGPSHQINLCQWTGFTEDIWRWTIKLLKSYSWIFNMPLVMTLPALHTNYTLIDSVQPSNSSKNQSRY
jgi:hypothetical protein